MAFLIQPHVRLHEWVAEELGLFSAEGLDYQLESAGFAGGTANPFSSGTIDLGLRSGALEDMAQGRKSDVSCACHWAVNAAASANMGKLYAKAYSVCPSGIYVSSNSTISRPEDLAGVAVGVGYHSGSHYSAIQSLSPFINRENIQLSYIGRPFDRTRLLMSADVQAVNVWGAAAYILELLGFKKIVDTTFIMGSFVSSMANKDDVENYFRALLAAQQHIDIQFQRFLPLWEREVPQDLLSKVDVRMFGPGERIVPQQYTKEMYYSTQNWMREWENLLEEAPSEKSAYENVVLV